MGDYTYYDGRGAHFEKERVQFGYSSKLTIGKFCQLAYGTTFLLADSNHQMGGFSTFPFFIFGTFGDDPAWKDYDCKFDYEGHTVVGNDVWFGHKACVCVCVCVCV